MKPLFVTIDAVTIDAVTTGAGARCRRQPGYRSLQSDSGSGSRLLSSSAGSPAIRMRSLAQSPKSSCRQRAEQNGRCGLAGPQVTGLAQFGQRTISVAPLTALPRSPRRTGQGVTAAQALASASASAT